MRRTTKVLALSVLFAAASTLSSCATILGTAVSPVTGGVDLCRTTLQRPNQWWAAPFVFVGGAVAGPFVALYNGVAYDVRVFRNFGAYWHGFDAIFRPFEMIQRQG